MDYAALNYPCPYCKAKIGEYCRSLRAGTIYRTSAHVEREAKIHKHKVQPVLNEVQEVTQETVAPKTVMVQIHPDVIIPVAVKPVVTRYAVCTTECAVLFQHPIYESRTWIPKKRIREVETHENSTIVYIDTSFTPEWK